MRHDERLALARRGLLTAAGGVAALPALPAASAPGTPAISPFRRCLGAFEVTPLLDGYFPMPAAYWSGIAPGDLAAAARRAFLDPAAPIRIGIAAWLLRDRGRTVLIDGGAGGIGMFAGTSGHLTQALAADGAAPGDVDAILLTHMHPDHVGGLLDGAAARFPRAQLMVTEPEIAFWTDAGMHSRAPEGFRPMFDLAADVAAAYGVRVTRLRPGSAPLPGITALPLPGHTPGHTGWRIESEGEALAVIGDAALVAAVQFARPEAMLLFDADAERARVTRLALFGELAQSRALVAGTHLPVPAFGHVVRDGGAYAWVPAEWPYA